MPRKRIDIQGEMFGKWKVIKQARNRGRHTLWLCKCECGKEKEVFTDHLLSGRSTKCKDCHQKTHGHYGEPPYHSWRAMKRRCYSKQDKDYKYYGGKGITVCSEWFNSFGNFRKWAISSGFKEGLVLDREDSKLNYCPDNCNWITASENTKRMLFERWGNSPCQCGL